MRKWLVIPLLMSMIWGCGGEGESNEEGSQEEFGAAVGLDFSSLNQDGDDKLNRDEWAASGRAAEAFTDFDEDGDELLSEAEVAEIERVGDEYTPCDPAACAGGDQCSLGTCVGGKGECVYEVNVGVPCDDGDVCTSSEYCQVDPESSGGSMCSIFGDGKSGTEYCQFDESNQGKDLGNHVKNFGMKNYEGCPYWMHQNCGTEKKVIWMILSTGW